MIRVLTRLVNRCARPRTSAVAAVLALALLAPREGASQDLAAPVVLKSRDVGFYIGYFNLERAERDPFVYDDTIDTLVGTAGVGYYWTEHVKTEVEFSQSGAGRTSGSVRLDRADVSPSFRLYTENETASSILTVAQSYQFFHNAWFHPFLTGGIDVAWERTRIRVPEQLYYPVPVFTPGSTVPRTLPPIVFPARADETSDRFTARAFGGGGFKAYFTPRAFFRTDLRVGAGEGRSLVARLGFGVDF